MRRAGDEIVSSRRTSPGRHAVSDHGSSPGADDILRAVGLNGMLIFDC